MKEPFDSLLHPGRTLVMGVVNVTPDSFSDGGRFLSPEAAIAHACRLMDEGADLLDIGGESTAPDSPPVDAQEECRRILPVLEECAKRGFPVSVDTYKSPVARCALAHGAGMINDVTALRGDPTLADVLAESDCAIVLMFAKDPTPRTTPTVRVYADVVREISEFLAERVAYAGTRGIAASRIVL
ncbi:MAG TPA: dihydropteroate synthase, partial [Candidatus Latescibacteria bacterium]|nr:dihydropteroate synthase [Candidatus Latescibacterota bacterium]